MSEDSGHVDLYSLVPRAEISAFKRELVSSGGLREATKFLQKSETRLRASAYPTTSRLFHVWTFLGFSHVFLVVIIPIILFFLTRWYWAIASIIFDIFIVQRVHNAVNLELFTRLYFTDKWMEEMETKIQNAEHNLNNG
jgi:hypothetical protein